MKVMRFSKEEHREWFNGQPRKPVSGAVVLTNKLGEVLLLKVNYRDNWNLPGGVAELHESPLDAAVRETKEEIGLTIDKSSLRLCAVDYRAAQDDLTDKLYFYFMGPCLDAIQINRISLQSAEIDEMRFVTLDAAKLLLSRWTYQQVKLSISGKAVGHYLEDGSLTYNESTK